MSTEVGTKVSRVTPAELGVATDIRFTDGLEVALASDAIVLANRARGLYQQFPRATEPLLNKLVTWCDVRELVAWACDGEEPASTLPLLIATLVDLIRLDVLTTREREWSGARLSPPGAGWAEAERFLRATRTTQQTVYALPADFNLALAQKAAFYPQPSAFYERVGAPFVALPEPRSEASADSPSFPDVMLARRTARRFANKPISAVELSTLLYFGWGMTATVPNPLGDVFVRKSSPSGGSLHPIEVYPIVLNVDGVESGAYHYSVRRHGLERLSLDDPKSWIVAACGDQAWVAEAAVVFLCTAFLPRTAWKYDFSRVLRAVISEIGYTGQAAFLAATWLGLGAFTTAALRDEMFEKVLGLDFRKEPPFSVTGAGHLEPELQSHARPRSEGAAGVESS